MRVSTAAAYWVIKPPSPQPITPIGLAGQLFLYQSTTARVFGSRTRPVGQFEGGAVEKFASSETVDLFLTIDQHRRTLQPLGQAPAYCSSGQAKR